MRQRPTPASESLVRGLLRLVPAAAVDQEPPGLRGPGRRRRAAPRHGAAARGRRLRGLLPGRLGYLLPQRRPRRRGRPAPPDEAPPSGGRRGGAGHPGRWPSESAMLAASSAWRARWPAATWPWSSPSTSLVNIAYSLGLKHEPILDLACVSAGFVLRAVAGGVATGGGRSPTGSSSWPRSAPC